VGLDDLPGDRQPEPAAALVPAAGVVEPGETVEDPVPVGGLDSRPVVGHHQLQLVALGP
jgi:hypothetical protein